MNTPLHIVLFEPEIPPNTGNIARLCAGLFDKGKSLFPHKLSKAEFTSPFTHRHSYAYGTSA